MSTQQNSGLNRFQRQGNALVFTPQRGLKLLFCVSSLMLRTLLLFWRIPISNLFFHSIGFSVWIFTWISLKIVVDLIGYLTYTIPVLGEVGDIVWAPASAFFIYQMFGSKLISLGGFVEEIVPGKHLLSCLFFFNDLNSIILSIQLLIRHRFCKFFLIFWNLFFESLFNLPFFF